MASAAGAAQGWQQEVLRSGSLVATLGLAYNFIEAQLAAVGVGLLAGGLLGFTQWPILRRAIPRSGLWIPANMLGGGLSMLGGIWIGIALAAFREDGLAWLAMNLVVGGPGVFILASLVTGAVLVRLLGKPQGSTPPPR
jgi:hypothetical protein